MPKLGGAVILMQANFNDVISQAAVQYVVGDPNIVAGMKDIKPFAPFADEVVGFFNELSKILLKTGRAYSDVMTFAFWCRKAALTAEKAKYDDLNGRIGKGIIFHSTPSNVAVNFAFSFAAGFLAGNANIVRLPAKDFEQVNIICSAIDQLLNGDFSDLRPYIVMLKYGLIQEVSDCFSSICDTRVVWGGDNTVKIMRQSPLKPRANEITFADRHSLAIINAEAYRCTANKRTIAQDFYNDTYFSDQNACTSPRIVVWYAENCDDDQIADIQNEFWNELHQLVREKYTLQPVQSVGKLSALYKVASRYEVAAEKMTDNFITRIRLDKIDSDLMQFKYNSGFFFELTTRKLSDLIPCCGEACQTLSYFGFDSEVLRTEIIALAPRGVDRIVPIGKTMDFTLIWDGHDLIREMSRRINCV